MPSTAPPALLAAIAACDDAALRASASACDAATLGAALHATVEEGWHEGAATLLRAGADVKALDAAGRTPALAAAGEGHLEILQLLQTRDKTVLSTQSSAGNSALHRAAAYGHPSVVLYLLEAGAAMDARNASGETALIRASRWGHAEVVAELLARGADTKTADESGRTAYDWATAKVHSDVLELLNAAAADDEAAAAADASNGAGVSPAEGEDMYYYEEGMEVGDAEDGTYVDYTEWGVPVRVEGWMAKKGHWVRNWKNRWFVLDGRTMAYYTQENARAPKGVINLIDGTDVIIEEKYSKPFCFTIITPTKRFILQAADEDEMAEWIEAIQNNLECCDADGNATADVAGDDD